MDQVQGVTERKKGRMMPRFGARVTGRVELPLTEMGKISGGAGLRWKTGAPFSVAVLRPKWLSLTPKWGCRVGS